MSTRQGYEAYKMYLALQRHFSSSYDYLKYNGKVPGSVASYEKRNDMYSFEKLTKIVQQEDLLDFFICHFIEEPKCWIRNMNKQNLENYKAKLRQFPTTFKEDLEFISMHNPTEVMAVNNDIPLIHKWVLDKKINVESIIAMDKFYPFIDKHSEKVKVPFVFPDYIEMVMNYRPFFVNKITDMHKDIMKSVLFE